MQKKIISILIFLHFCLSCNNSGNKNIKDFENVFEISAIDAVKFGLPAIDFKITYPDDIEAISAKEGEYNPNYIEFYYIEDEVFHESLSIGIYESASLADEFIKQSLLDQYIAQYQSQLLDIEVVFNGQGDFMGKQLYQLKLKFEIVDEMYGYKGNYKMLLVLYPPDNGSENGVLLIFQATENSDIEDFNDFGKEGKTAKIWQTFRFI